MRSDSPRKVPDPHYIAISGAVVDGDGMYERRDPVVAPRAYVKRRNFGYWQRAVANGLAGGTPSWKVNASMFTWLSTVVTVLVLPRSAVVSSSS